MIPNATVSIYSDAAMTHRIAVGTTDGDGVLSLAIPTTGTWYWKVSHSSGRVADETGEGSCSYPEVDVEMDPADGYHYSRACPLPLKDTLYYSDSYLGSATLQWGETDSDDEGDFTGWFGTIEKAIVIPALASVDCSNTTDHIDIRFDGEFYSATGVIPPGFCSQRLWSFGSCAFTSECPPPGYAATLNCSFNIAFPPAPFAVSGAITE